MEVKECDFSWSSYEIPREVTDAAMLIEQFFMEKGCCEWQLLGICSRNHAVELEKARRKLELIVEVIRRCDDPDLCPK